MKKRMDFGDYSYHISLGSGLGYGYGWMELHDTRDTALYFTRDLLTVTILRDQRHWRRYALY